MSGALYDEAEEVTGAEEVPTPRGNQASRGRPKEDRRQKMFGLRKVKFTKPLIRSRAPMAEEEVEVEPELPTTADRPPLSPIPSPSQPQAPALGKQETYTKEVSMEGEGGLLGGSVGGGAGLAPVSGVGPDGTVGGGDDSEDEDGATVIQGAYDPAEFAHLPVSTEVKDLFAYITAYQAQTVELDHSLRPFVLDYVPAVGDIDAFIKIPRPDEVEDNLGLVILDEPCAAQSDSTVLNLHLRALTKEEGASKETVRKQLPRADKNPKEIDQWIASIKDLHKSKPPTSVHYNRPMPDLDALMGEWPPEVEEALKTLELPRGAEMGMSLEEYVDVLCGLLDIPVGGSRVHSLHLLFSLYSEFKNSQHFKALADENQLDNNQSFGGDRLEL